MEEVFDLVRRREECSDYAVDLSDYSDPGLLEYLKKRYKQSENCDEVETAESAVKAENPLGHEIKLVKSEDVLWMTVEGSVNTPQKEKGWIRRVLEGEIKR